MRQGKDNEEVIKQIAYHYEEILKLIGEDPRREGLVKTPLRAAKALYDVTEGYFCDAKDIISQAIFEHSGSKMIVVKDIEFYSLCEHHILPFFGKVAVGYIPDGKMIGLSKLARIVNVFAKRLQVQERLTAQICDVLSKTIPNKGVITVVEAEHLCMKMRGVEKQDSSTQTIDYTGMFESDPGLRNEFLRMISY